jgi:hypothetical protein
VLTENGIVWVEGLFHIRKDLHSTLGPNTGYPTMFLVISSAPWYISNQTLHDNLKIPLVKDLIHSQATKCRNRNKDHVNELVTALTDVPPVIRRLERL